MQYIERHKTWILLGMVAITIAAFIALRDGRGGAERFVTDPAETAPSTTNELDAANCGHCYSQSGALVDCYKPTNRYTCASQGTLCRTGSLCQ